MCRPPRTTCCGAGACLSSKPIYFPELFPIRLSVVASCLGGWVVERLSGWVGECVGLCVGAEYFVLFKPPILSYHKSTTQGILLSIPSFPALLVQYRRARQQSSSRSVVLFCFVLLEVYYSRDSAVYSIPCGPFGTVKSPFLVY